MAYLNKEDSAKITAAVSEAELNTSGEIVTVLADRSDGYSDVVLVWASVIAFTAMSIFALWPHLFLGKIDWILGRWGQEWSLGSILTLMLGFGLMKFFGVWLILLWDPLKFLLIPGPVKTARVHDRAVSLFKVGAERRTHGRTGVLIYLSMREHRAEIVADEAIASKVSAEIWGEAMADMLAQIKQGHIADGMVAGIGDVAKVLAEHFPRNEDDQNEIPDRLIEI